MPLGYERDDTQRRIVSIGEGPFSVDEVIGFFERMRSDGTWAYGALYEMLRMAGRPSVEDLRRIMEGAAMPGPNGEHAGPMAVVAADPALYGTACAYAAMGPPGKFNVFADRADAEEWLTEHTSLPPK